MINNNISPIEDEDIYYYLNNKKLNLKATCNYQVAFDNSKYIIICTPTNFDYKTNSFDTSSIEDAITKIKNVNNDAVIIIKSTVPIGYTKMIKNRYNMNIIFSPEFLREGKSLHDNLYPSKIIVGSKSSDGIKFAEILKIDGINVVIYEPKINDNTYLECKIINDLSKFVNMSSIILANRIDKNIEDNKKIFTRDIFNNN